jgi:hypothetical protein
MKFYQFLAFSFLQELGHISQQTCRYHSVKGPSIEMVGDGNYELLADSHNLKENFCQLQDICSVMM